MIVVVISQKEGSKKSWQFKVLNDVLPTFFDIKEANKMIILYTHFHSSNREHRWLYRETTIAMGSSASCSLDLASTGKPLYWTGEIVSGHAVLAVHNSIAVKSINMNLTGQRVHSETRSNHHSGLRTVTVRNDFFAQKINCLYLQQMQYLTMR